MKVEEINRFSVDKGESSSLDLNQEMKWNFLLAKESQEVIEANKTKVKRFGSSLDENGENKQIFCW